MTKKLLTNFYGPTRLDDPTSTRHSPPLRRIGAQRGVRSAGCAARGALRRRLHRYFYVDLWATSQKN